MKNLKITIYNKLTENDIRGNTSKLARKGLSTHGFQQLLKLANSEPLCQQHYLNLQINKLQLNNTQNFGKDNLKMLNMVEVIYEFQILPNHRFVFRWGHLIIQQVARLTEAVTPNFNFPLRQSRKGFLLIIAEWVFWENEETPKNFIILLEEILSIFWKVDSHTACA